MRENNSFWHALSNFTDVLQHKKLYTPKKHNMASLKTNYIYSNISRTITDKCDVQYQCTPLRIKIPICMNYGCLVMRYL